MLCSRKTCLLALCSSLRLSGSLLRRLIVCENKNNSDKLHRRKSMRAVDEKLIINELGPNFDQVSPFNPILLPTTISVHQWLVGRVGGGYEARVRVKPIN